MNDSSEPMPRPEGMVFPCDIDVKIFLKNNDNNLELVKDVLLRDIPSGDVLEVAQKQSSQGKYQSFSCKIYARSKDQMDLLYTKLTAHPDVVMVI